MTERPDETMNGLDACASVLHRAVSAYAVAGGEGARRLADALAAVAVATGEGGPQRLEGDGIAAARAALGTVLAGHTAVVIASGDATASVTPVLREAARMAAPLVVIVPAHGDDRGRTLPDARMFDLTGVLDGPAGVVLAGDAEQLADLTLAALRAARDRRAPWVVGFELAGVGLALATFKLPSAHRLAEWASDAKTGAHGSLAHAESPGVVRSRSVARYGFALAAAAREIERETGRAGGLFLHQGPRDADVVLLSAGASARGARELVRLPRAVSELKVACVQVLSLRPFAASEIVRLTWRARVVIVHEIAPDAVGMNGRLSEGLKAAYVDALTWHPDHAGIGRVPTVATLYVQGRAGVGQWAEALHAVDAHETPRWIELAGEGV